MEPCTQTLHDHVDITQTLSGNGKFINCDIEFYEYYQYHPENIWIGPWRYRCLGTWSCNQLIAKPGNKKAAHPWPDAYDVVVFDTLHWRHNDHDGISNHQLHGCLLNRLFRCRSKKTSKLRVTGLCVGNSLGPVNSPHKGPVTQKMFSFDDVIMILQPLMQLRNTSQIGWSSNATETCSVFYHM